MSTIKEVLANFKKELGNTLQAQKNIVDVTQKYIGLLENAETEGGSGDVTYSTTTEQKVGKWIDGKDLFVKVIQPTITSTTTVNGDIKYGSFSLADYLTGVDMAMFDVGKSYMKTSTTATRGFMTIYYEKDSGDVTVMTFFSRSEVPADIVVYYTKAT